MNLYELLGLIAIAGGLGVSYSSTQSHPVMAWFALGVAACAGWATFIAMRCLTDRVRNPNPARLEAMLMGMYAAMFIAVLTATIVSAWLVRLIAA